MLRRRVVVATNPPRGKCPVGRASVCVPDRARVRSRVHASPGLTGSKGVRSARYRSVRLALAVEVLPEVSAALALRLTFSVLFARTSLRPFLVSFRVTVLEPAPVSRAVVEPSRVDPERAVTPAV